MESQSIPTQVVDAAPQEAVQSLESIEAVQGALTPHAAIFQASGAVEATQNGVAPSWRMQEGKIKPIPAATVAVIAAAVGFYFYFPQVRATFDSWIDKVQGTDAWKWTDRQLAEWGNDLGNLYNNLSKDQVAVVSIGILAGFGLYKAIQRSNRK